MKRLKVVLTDLEWTIAAGILEEAGIPFSVLNEQFSSLYPGARLGAFEREILVADEQYDEARDLLHDFFSE